MAISGLNITKQTLANSYNDNVYNYVRTQYRYYRNNYPANIGGGWSNWTPNPNNYLANPSTLPSMTTSNLSSLSNPINASQAINAIVSFTRNYTSIRTLRFWQHYTGDNQNTVSDNYYICVTNAGLQNVPSANLNINQNSTIYEPTYTNLLNNWRNIANSLYQTIESTAHTQWGNHSARVRR